MTEAVAKRRSEYKRDPVRAMMLKAKRGDTLELESYLEDDGELFTSHKLWLADVLESLRLAPFAEARGAPSRVQLDKTNDGVKSRKLAMLCAAYLVRRCARRQREWTRKPASRETLLKLAKHARGIVHAHFDIKRNMLSAKEIIGAEGDKHSPYRRVPHDDIMLMVHSELRKPMRDMLAWHKETFVPKEKEMAKV